MDRQKNILENELLALDGPREGNFLKARGGGGERGGPKGKAILFKEEGTQAAYREKKGGNGPLIQKGTEISKKKTSPFIGGKGCTERNGLYHGA